MEAFAATVVFIGGLMVGSFLNVLSLRFGFSEARRHRSGCQACGETLRWYELLPVLSYLALRGRCRSCGSKLSLQYPVVELVTGLLFVVSYLASPLETLADGVVLAALLAWLSVFVLLTVYDVRHTLVPLPFAFSLLGLAVILRAFEALFIAHPSPLVDGVFGGLLLAGFLALLVVVTRGRGMGTGDIYVAGALGILFGVARGIEVLTVAFWLGALFGVSAVLWNVLSTRFSLQRPGKTRRGLTMKSEVPFVPFLFVATLVGLYVPVSPFELIGYFTQVVFP